MRNNKHTSATPNKYNKFLNNNDTKIKNKNEILNNINKKNINFNKASNNNQINNTLYSNNLNLNRKLILEENLNNKKETYIIKPISNIPCKITKIRIVKKKIENKIRKN